jgi:hypothetical protein
VKRSGDRWLCSECGHHLEVDQSLAMETALSLTGDDGPCSAKNMTFAQTALYIRTLELRWMDDQRRIHRLERELKMLAEVPFPERAAWSDAGLLDAEQRTAPARARAGALAG